MQIFFSKEGGPLLEEQWGKYKPVSAYMLNHVKTAQIIVLLNMS